MTAGAGCGQVHLAPFRVPSYWPVARLTPGLCDNCLRLSAPLRAIKIAATTTKVSVTAVVVDRIGWRTKVKARLLTEVRCEAQWDALAKLVLGVLTLVVC
jgi:hypothetical protein